MNYDLVILNGKIYTMNPLNPIVEAVGVTEDRIRKVGSNSELRSGISKKTNKIDASGKVMIPGFVDGHTHFANMGFKLLNYIDVGGSKASCLGEVQNAVNQKEKDEWVYGFNLDQSKWQPGETLRKDDIDKIAPDNPVVLHGVHGSIAVVNSKALNLLNVNSSMEGIDYRSGEPTGVIRREAQRKFEDLIEPDVQEIKKGIQKAMAKATKLGVTTVNDASNGWVHSKKLKAYRELSNESKLDLQVNLFLNYNHMDELSTNCLKKQDLGESLRFGCLKLFADGSIGARSAWISEPYQDDPNNTGKKLWNQEELLEVLRRANKNNVQVAIHAIGDCAIGQTLECFKDLRKQQTEVARHRIEHCELVTEDQIAEIAELGLVVVVQPNFIGKWGHPGGMYEQRLGRKRLEAMNPLAEFYKQEVSLGFASDGIPFDPLYGVHSAINAPFEGQNISPKQAIYAYTLGSAYASNLEEEVGSIKPNKFANVVLLDGDPFENPSQVDRISPELTIYKGRIVFEREN